MKVLVTQGNNKNFSDKRNESLINFLGFPHGKNNKSDGIGLSIELNHTPHCRMEFLVLLQLRQVT